MDAKERNRLAGVAKSRAYRALASRYPDEFGDLLHTENHRVRLGHIHSPDKPETIDWWGDEPSEVAS